MKKQIGISTDEEMLMWTSYRYCIGRQTYVSTLAPYIGKKYYPLLSNEQSDFTAKDIRRCIEDVLNHGLLTFKYDGTIFEDERDALNDFLTWLNENIQSDKDLIGIDTIECYRESYKKDEPKKFFVTKKSHYEFSKYEHEFSDLLVWHKLSSLFDRKNHVKVLVKYDGKEECKECFYAWCKTLTQVEDGLYKNTPWKYEKRLVSVERYLERGEYCGYLNEECITKIERYE